MQEEEPGYHEESIVEEEVGDRKKPMTLSEIFEPEIMRRKYLTLEDKEIKLKDVPERIQVCKGWAGQDIAPWGRKKRRYIQSMSLALNKSCGCSYVTLGEGRRLMTSSRRRRGGFWNMRSMARSCPDDKAATAR